MEPIMTSLKVLSAAAAIALLLPLAAPADSFAQGAIGGRGGGGGGGGAAVGGGGGGGMRAGGGGGGFGGGRSFAASPGGGGGVIGGGGPRYGGGGAAIGGGPRYSGGNWQGGGYNRHHYRRGYGGFGTGLVIGGALGSSYGYYGDPYGYYDDGYYDEPAVAVAPGGDDVEYCRQRFRSYDVRTGTYLGNDGLRHACP
jgi:hypothetical protein